MIDDLKNLYHNLPPLSGFSDYIPFLCFVDGKAHLNTARITEMLIGAVIIAGISAYILLQVLDAKFDIMERQLTEVKAQVTYTNTRIDKLYESKRR